MNSRIKNIILSILLFISFFTPWLSLYGYGISGSPFDLIMFIFENFKFIEKDPSILLSLLFLILPVSAFIIFFNYIRLEIKKSSLGWIVFAKKAPMILFVAAIIFAWIKLEDFVGVDLFRVIGVGFYIAFITCVVLFFDRTKSSNSSTIQK